MTLVVDASMVVAGLTDSGADGGWAESLLAGDALAAPHLMPVEAANICGGRPWPATSPPTWHRWRTPTCWTCAWSSFPTSRALTGMGLRANVTCYDGWYVAVAELLDAPLATLDGRLANSPGPRCQFLLPPAAT